jgi:CheY-like chemotaxis protein
MSSAWREGQVTEDQASHEDWDKARQELRSKLRGEEVVGHPGCFGPSGFGVDTVAIEAENRRVDEKRPSMPTILCIDDQTSSLKIRKLLLEIEGYSVIAAEGGQSGLEELAEHSIQAVILDYRMPDMDGFQVAQAIRKRHGNMPIILLTGYPQELPRELLDIVDAFILKGEPAEVLLGELKRLTGGAKRPSQAEIASQAIEYLRDKKRDRGGG